MSAQRNALTLDSTGQLLSWGYVPPFVAGAGETAHTNVSGLVDGVPDKHTKIVGSVLTEMNAGEKTVVDDALIAKEQLESTGSPQLLRTYATVADLPVSPFKSGLLVRILDVGDSSDGFAFSIGGSWKVYSPNSDLILRHPTGFPEVISSNTALDPDRFVSRISGNGRDVTLVNGNTDGQTKLIQTDGGSSCNVVCSLESPNVSFDLSAQSKAQLVWDESNQFYFVIDEKNLTFVT